MILCHECEDTNVTVTMQVDRGKHVRVRFRVDCDRCGCFSHYLEHGERERAIQRWLEERNFGSYEATKP